MSAPTDTLFYRLLARPLVYPIANVDEANALWNALVAILGFHTKIPQTQEESFIRVFDINTDGTTRTLKKEAVEVTGSTTIVQDDPIGTLDFIEFQIDTILEQTTPNRGRMIAIWNRLVTDAPMFVSIDNPVFDTDTNISIHSCQHDFAGFPDCTKFKEIINTTVTIDEAFP